MRASGDDPDGCDPLRETGPDRARTEADPIGEIGELRRAAARLGDLGIAEFGGLAAALGAIERDLAATGPDQPEGRRLRQDLAARLDRLGEALQTLLDLVDRLRRRPM